RPRPRGHALAVTVRILAVVIVLVLLIGVPTSHAQEPVTQAAPDVPVAPAWHAAGTLDVSMLNSNNDPENDLFRTRGTTPTVDAFGINMAAASLKKAAGPASRWGVELTAQAGRDTHPFRFSPTPPNIDSR